MPDKFTDEIISALHDSPRILKNIVKPPHYFYNGITILILKHNKDSTDIVSSTFFNIYI